MIKQTKCNVVLIDSGISSFYRSKECVTGINIDKSDIGYTIDDNINDSIGHGTLTIDDAKEYLYSFSTRRRVYNGKDLNVSVWT